MSNVILYATGKDTPENFALKCSNDGILEVSATVTTSSDKPIETKTVLYDEAGTNKISTYHDTGDSTYSVYTYDKQNALNTTTLNNSIVTLDADIVTNNSNLATLNDTITTNNSNVSTLNDTITTNNYNLTTLNNTLTTNNTNLSGNSDSLDLNTNSLTLNAQSLDGNVIALDRNSDALTDTSGKLLTNNDKLTLNSNNLISNSGYLNTNNSRLQTNSTALDTNGAYLDSNSAALLINNTNMATNSDKLSGNTDKLQSNNDFLNTNNLKLKENSDSLVLNNSFLTTNNNNLSTNSTSLTNNTSAVNDIGGKLTTLNNKLAYLNFDNNELQVVTSEGTSSSVLYGSNYDTVTPGNHPIYVDESGFITATVNSSVHENIPIGYTNNVTSMSVLSSSADFFSASNPVCMEPTGWYYSKTSATATNGSLLWYNNGPYGSTMFPTQADVQVKDVDIFYVIMKNYKPSNQSYIYMNVYTRPQGSGDFNVNYRSKFNYILNGNPGIAYGKSYMLYQGNTARVRNNDTECPRVPYVFSTSGSSGPCGDLEVVSHIEIQFYNPGGIDHSGVVVEGGLYVKQQYLINYYFTYEWKETAEVATNKLTFSSTDQLKTSTVISDGTGTNVADVVANSTTTNLKNKVGLVSDSVLYAQNSSGDIKNVMMDASGNLNVNIASGTISVSSVNIKDGDGNNLKAVSSTIPQLRTTLYDIAGSNITSDAFTFNSATRTGLDVAVINDVAHPVNANITGGSVGISGTANVSGSLYIRDSLNNEVTTSAISGIANKRYLDVVSNEKCLVGGTSTLVSGVAMNTAKTGTTVNSFTTSLDTSAVVSAYNNTTGDIKVISMTESGAKRMLDTNTRVTNGTNTADVDAMNAALTGKKGIETNSQVYGYNSVTGDNLPLTTTLANTTAQCLDVYVQNGGSSKGMGDARTGLNVYSLTPKYKSYVWSGYTLTANGIYGYNGTSMTHNSGNYSQFGVVAYMYCSVAKNISYEYVDINRDLQTGSFSLAANTWTPLPTNDPLNAYRCSCINSFMETSLSYNNEVLTLAYGGQSSVYGVGAITTLNYFNGFIMIPNGYIGRITNFYFYANTGSVFNIFKRSQTSNNFSKSIFGGSNFSNSVVVVNQFLGEILYPGDMIYVARQGTATDSYFYSSVTLEPY